MTKERALQDTKACERLDPARLYHTDLDNGKGTFVFYPGLVQDGLIQLHIIFPKEEWMACHIGRVKDFIPVDPVQLGTLYTDIMKVIDEYRRSVNDDDN